MLRKTVGVGVAAGVFSALGALTAASPVSAHGDGSSGDEGQVTMKDNCQPASFNAALHTKVCVGDGTMTFGAFIAELTATKSVAAWRFDPSMLTIRRGRPVILENDGGETHSFTLVKMFGGGFIAPLNQLSGNPVPAQECATTLPDGTLAPKPASAVNVFVAADRERAFKTAGLKPGRYLFECCIHPWMRVVLTVR